MSSLRNGNDLAGFREGACSSPAAASCEVLEVPSQEAVDGCGDEERVTRLPAQKGISDALWRSRHLPRHLYRSNQRIISDERQALDE